MILNDIDFILLWYLSLWTPRVKPWVIQSFLTFDSMDRTLTVIGPFTGPFTGKLLSRDLLWCCLVFNFTQFVILENLSVLDLALSGMKELKGIHSKYVEKIKNNKFPLCCSKTFHASSI